MRYPIFFLTLLLTLASCSSQSSALPGAIPVPTTTPGAVQQSQPGSNAPITAEETLYVFLLAYENDPNEMVPFLHPALRENLSAGGIPELLGFEGPLEGLVFTSGTTTANPNLAVVEASLQVGGLEIERIFYLELQEDSWLITGVEKVEE